MGLCYLPNSSSNKNRNMSSNGSEEELYKKFNLIPSEELEYGPVCGHGTFGQIRIARWKGELVATKSFHYKQNFHAEIKHFPQEKHPNIIKLFGICPKHSLLVLEYAEIGSLHHILHERIDVKYNLSHAVNWCLQTARGVSYLHSIKPKPMMHRDLKPPNLLVFDEGRVVKLCDFGTLRMVDTEVTNQRGSAVWMAPEVFQTKSYSEKCDIYSFGIILWEILSRQKPYEDITESCRIFWLVAAGMRPPFLKNCPEVLEKMMVRCWDEEISRRPDIHFIVDCLQNFFNVDEKDIYRSTTLFIPTESPVSSQNSSPLSSMLSSDVLNLTLPLEIRTESSPSAHSNSSNSSALEAGQKMHTSEQPGPSRRTLDLPLRNTSFDVDMHSPIYLVDPNDTYNNIDSEDFEALLSPDLVPTKPNELNPKSMHLYELHREEAKNYLQKYFNIIVLEENRNERLLRTKTDPNNVNESSIEKLKTKLNAEKEKYTKMIEEKKISLKTVKERNQFRLYAMEEGWVVID